MVSVHSKREREMEGKGKRGKEGKQAAPNPTPGTFTPFTAKMKDRCNSPYFTHTRKQSAHSLTHSLSHSFFLFS